MVVWFKWLSGSARCLGLCVLAACGQHANLDPDENEIKASALDVPATTDSTVAATRTVPEAGRFGRDGGEGWRAQRRTVMTTKQGQQVDGARCRDDQMRRSISPRDECDVRSEGSSGRGEYTVPNSIDLLFCRSPRGPVPGAAAKAVRATNGKKKPPDGRKTGTAEGARGERGKEDGCTGTDMEPCTDERLMAGETRSG